VAEQGYLAPLEHGADSSCRSLYALALMFPPKLGSHKHTHRWRRRARARAATRSAGGPTTTASWVTGSSSWGRSRRRPSWSCSKRPTSCRWAATKKFFANRDLQGFGGRALTGPFRDARRLSLYTMVPRTGATRSTLGLGFGVCSSFKDHSLSCRATPILNYDSQLLHRCKVYCVDASCTEHAASMRRTLSLLRRCVVAAGGDGLRARAGAGRGRHAVRVGQQQLRAAGHGRLQGALQAHARGGVPRGRGRAHRRGAAELVRAHRRRVRWRSVGTPAP
jgi:hypothetical protein